MSSINATASLVYCRLPSMEGTARLRYLRMGAGHIPLTSRRIPLRGVGALPLPAFETSHHGVAARVKYARRLPCSVRFRKTKLIVAAAGESESRGPARSPLAPLVARSLATAAAVAALAMAVKHHTVTVQGLVWAGANFTELSLLLVQALRYPSPDNLMELQALSAYMIKTFATSVARALGEWTLMELNQAWAAFEALTVALSSRLLNSWLCVGQALAGGVQIVHSKATALLSGSTSPLASWALQIIDFVVLVALWNPFTVPAAALFTVTKVICSWMLSTVETACALLYITPTITTGVLLGLGLAINKLMPYARALSHQLAQAVLAGSPSSPFSDSGKDADASRLKVQVVADAERKIPSNQKQEDVGVDLVMGMRAEVDRVMAQVQSAHTGIGAGKELNAASTTARKSNTAAVQDVDTKHADQGTAMRKMNMHALSGAAASDASQAQKDILQALEEQEKSRAKENQKFVVLDQSPLFRAAPRPITNEMNDPTSPGSPEATLQGSVEANKLRTEPMDADLAEDWAGAFSSSPDTTDENTRNDEDRAIQERVASFPVPKVQLPLPSRVPESPKPTMIKLGSVVSEPGNAEGVLEVQPDTKSAAGSVTNEERDTDDASGKDTGVEKRTQGQGRQSDTLTDLTDTLELGGLLLSLPAKALSKSLKLQKEAQALRKMERDAQELSPPDAPKLANIPVRRTNAKQTLPESKHASGDDITNKGLLEQVPDNILSTLEVVSSLGGGAKKVRAKEAADEEPMGRKRVRSIWEALGAAPAERGAGGATRKWKPPVR